MTRAEQVLCGLFIESHGTSHMGANLGKGDDPFVGPRETLSIQVELFWANSDKKYRVLGNVI
jgi:hypothetical protein